MKQYTMDVQNLGCKASFSTILNDAKPNLTESGAGGAVLKGESFELGARRELLEETVLNGTLGEQR